MQKTWSFSSDSQELVQPSQNSNFSDCSDLNLRKELLKIKSDSKVDKLNAIKKCLEGINIEMPQPPCILKDQTV